MIDDGQAVLQQSDTVDNEFLPQNSNVRGTLAMARPAGSIDGASNQWFINVDDRNAASLDAQAFTVFGRVIGTSISVVDEIFELDTFDVSSAVNSPSFTTTPLVDDYEGLSRQITGTVDLTQGSNVLTGDGTLFTNDLEVNGSVTIGGETFTWRVWFLTPRRRLRLAPLSRQPTRQAKCRIHRSSKILLPSRAWN